MSNSTDLIRYREEVSSAKTCYHSAASEFVSELRAGIADEALKASLHRFHCVATSYFNSVELLVDKTELAGCHHLSWLRSVAGDCEASLGTLAQHHKLLQIACKKLNLDYAGMFALRSNAFSSVKRHARKYLSRGDCDALRREFLEQQLPIKDLEPITAARRLLSQAIDAVPAVKYALGIAGIGAAGFLVVGFYKDSAFGFLAIFIMIVLMVGLVVFARLAATSGANLRHLVTFFAWAMALLFLAGAVLSLTSLFFGIPRAFGPVH